MRWPTEKEISRFKEFVKSEKNKNLDLLRKDAKQWIRTSWANKISYEITWLGIPIIQLPEDIILMQELIFKVRPDVIIETGIAHGGSLIFYSSMMEILGKGKVIGIDIEIREHNRKAMEAHPMFKRIELIEGGSTEPEVIEKVEKIIPKGSTVLVCFDSNHSKEHVKEEIKTYSKLVTPGSYLVVFDTIMPELVGLQGSHDNWVEDNPMEAIKEFLEVNDDFEIDSDYNKLFVSHCPNGFLRRRR